MSVIVKDRDGHHINFIKGADMAIIPRLNSDYQEQDSEFNDKSISHMDDFAKDGLRTLMFAKKTLTQEQAQKALEKDSDPELYESSLELLGVTGLEDLLQENVKNCIKQFKEAKIKVWMLTGDKGETAETIGVSCGLIDTENQTVFNINSAPRPKLL